MKQRTETCFAFFYIDIVHKKGEENMKRTVSLVLALAMSASMVMTGCGSSNSSASSNETSAVGDASVAETSTSDVDTSSFLKIADDNPDTVDPECTTEYYGVSMNIFNRLVEVQSNDDGTSEIVPSLAKSYEVSDDGLTYTFTLNEGVKYTNGAELTSDDVLYTFTRLLTYDKSVNGDVVSEIKGAEALHDGTADTLEGFEVIDDYNFKVTLEEPYAAFLACLSTPACSILDRETTEEAGEDFGIDPEKTIGTGSFIFHSWTYESELILVANQDCWSGAPACDGIDIKVVPDEDTQRMMFENGELDILDLDNAPSQVDYFLDNDAYQDEIVSGNRVGIYYIAMNENVEPLNNVDVRKAIQMCIDRQSILDALFGGRGTIENGIFPTGLIGHNNDLDEIPYDVDEAKQLLADAGYPDGFDIEISQSSEASSTTSNLNQIVQAMLAEIGINATINIVDDASYIDMRNSGEFEMYNASWSADYNDPDNFIYTFFGSEENTDQRCLSYSDTDIIDRVAAARGIVDDDDRIAEYQALEKKIVQDDAAWVPLFSVKHLFVVNPRVKNFKVSWNGWSNNYYQNVGIEE